MSQLIPETFTFFRGQFKYMKDKGFEIHGVSSPRAYPCRKFPGGRKFQSTVFPMPRKITLGTDLVGVFKLLQLFWKYKPTIVHAHTPKGGLLGVGTAGRQRVCWRPFTACGPGLFVTQSGYKRQLLITTEILACRLARQGNYRRFGHWKQEQCRLEFVLPGRFLDLRMAAVMG